MRQRMVKGSGAQNEPASAGPPFLVPASDSGMAAWGISAILHYIIYFACGLLLLAVLILGIFELIRLSHVHTNVSTLLTNTDPFPVCASEYACHTQWDCPQLEAVDLRELDSWNITDPDTFYNLSRTCLLGKCFYKHQMQFHAPNMSEFCMGENSLLLYEVDNSTDYYNATFPPNLLYPLTSVERTTFGPWGDVFSSLCMSFMTTDSQSDLLKAHLSYLEYDNGADILYSTCYYTYACTVSFTLGGAVDFI